MKKLPMPPNALVFTREELDNMWHAVEEQHQLLADAGKARRIIKSTPRTGKGVFYRLVQEALEQLG